ncbi:hypothetical protein ACFL54_06280 [Planctomycetota bacterium]
MKTIVETLNSKRGKRPKAWARLVRIARRQVEGNPKKTDAYEAVEKLLRQANRPMQDFENLIETFERYRNLTAKVEQLPQKHDAISAVMKTLADFDDETKILFKARQSEAFKLKQTLEREKRLLHLAEKTQADLDVFEQENSDLLGIKKKNLDDFSLKTHKGGLINFCDPTSPELFVTSETAYQQTARRGQIIRKMNAIAMNQWEQENSRWGAVKTGPVPAKPELGWADRHDDRYRHLLADRS